MAGRQLVMAFVELAALLMAMVYMAPVLVLVLVSKAKAQVLLAPAVQVSLAMAAQPLLVATAASSMAPLVALASWRAAALPDQE